MWFMAGRIDSAECYLTAVRASAPQLLPDFRLQLEPIFSEGVWQLGVPFVSDAEQMQPPLQSLSR